MGSQRVRYSLATEHIHVQGKWQGKTTLEASLFIDIREIVHALQRFPGY